MRLLGLELETFGAFERHALDFGPDQGFHFIYGLNEAGKSTTLRALRALFFGIPAKTGDNFRYASRKLRIGGHLRLQDGSELKFYRKKGRKITLLTAGGEPMDEAELAPFLNGVDQRLFDTLFGIDHETLARGGEELLAQGGAVGGSLFAAGTGMAHLRQVESELKSEFGRLFLRTGKKPEINEAAILFNEKRKLLDKSVLAPETWHARRNELQELERGLEAIKREKAGLVGERRRLERLERAIPQLAERAVLKKKRRELGSIPKLSPGFSDRRRNALREKETAIRIREKALRKAASLREEMEAMYYSPEVLERAVGIERLSRGVGEYRKYLEDRAKFTKTRDSAGTLANTIADELLQDGREVNPETLYESLAHRGQVRRLAQRWDEIRAFLEQAEKNRDRLLAETGRMEIEGRDREPFRNTEKLRLILADAREEGDLDRRIEEDLGETAQLEEEAAVILAQLSPAWPGALDELEKCALPSIETIEAFEIRFIEARQSRERVMESIRVERQELRRQERDLNAVKMTGDIPSEQALQQARARRDAGWDLLKAQWLEGEDVTEEASGFAPGVELAAAYERARTDSDEIADRLWRESRRVHQYAELRARIESGRSALEALNGELSALKKEEAAHRKEWRTLWRPFKLEPLSPREMRAWSARAAELRQTSAKLRTLHARVSSHSQKRNRHRDALARELTRFLTRQEVETESLAMLLRQSEKAVERLEAENRRGEELERKLGECRTALAEAETQTEKARGEWTGWQRRWEEVTEKLGLLPKPTPENAEELMDRLKECYDHLSQVQDMDSLLELVDQNIETFCREVQDLAKELLGSAEPEHPEPSLNALQQLLHDHRETATLLKTKAGTLRELELEIEEAGITAAEMEQRLLELREEAGCEREDQVDELERGYAEAKAIEEKLSAIEEALIRDCAGGSLADLEKEAKSVDADALAGEIENLARQIEELERETHLLYQKKGKEKHEFEQMDGGDRAAQLAEEMEEIMTGIRAKGERYLRFKLASLVLASEIERYRARSQAPVLGLAREHFEALTLGSFSDLRTDYNDRDQLILLGVRPGGETVGVDGMSAGTRDQLYLALRLATLEWRLERAESFPFIVDDILINFDGPRAAAALDVLVKLSRKTQIIFFTHQRDIVAHARRELSTEDVRIHELQPGPTTASRLP